MVLAAQPSAEVTVTVSGHDGTDLSLSGPNLSAANTLTFTPANWNAAQTVTVSAAQDDDAVADPTVTLTHAVAGSGEYSGVVVDSVTVTIADDDTASVSVSPTVLAVPEGGSGSYTVVLTAEPGADVTVTVGGHAGSDVAVSPGVLTFTPANWDTAQTVTVTADHDNDAAADDAVTLSHAVSGSGEYASVTAGSVVVTIDEDDTAGEQDTADEGDTDDEDEIIGEGDAAGVTVDPVALRVVEGASNTYSVVLDTRPSADVTVTVGGHAGSDVSVDKTKLTFMPANWDVPQTVTVTAAHDPDAVADDPVTLTHAVSGTGEYASVTADSVTVTIADDDPTTPDDPTPDDPTPDDPTPDDPTPDDPTPDDPTPDDPTPDDPTPPSDDSAGVTVRFEKTYHNIDEGAAGGAGVGIVLSAALETEVTIRVVVLSGGTASSEDYSLSDTGLESGSQTGFVSDPGLTFVPGETFGYVRVAATADLDDEGEEDVLLGFGTLPEGITAGQPATTSVTIHDPQSDVSFGSSTYEATEGGPDAEVTVQLDGPLPMPVSMPLTVEGHSGADSSDWSGVPDSVTFDTGATTAAFTVVAVDDAVEDDGEMVMIGFGTLPSMLIAASPTTATVTLMNDDITPEDTSSEDTPPPVGCDSSLRMVIEPRDKLVEGGRIGTGRTSEERTNITVSADCGLGQDQTIALEFGGDATMGDDYSVSGDGYDASSQTLTLRAGATSVSATITALRDDDDLEATETIEVAAHHGNDDIGGGTVWISPCGGRYGWQFIRISVDRTSVGDDQSRNVAPYATVSGPVTVRVCFCEPIVGLYPQQRSSLDPAVTGTPEYLDMEGNLAIVFPQHSGDGWIGGTLTNARETVPGQIWLVDVTPEGPSGRIALHVFTDRRTDNPEADFQALDGTIDNTYNFGFTLTRDRQLTPAAQPARARGVGSDDGSGQIGTANRVDSACVRCWLGGCRFGRGESPRMVPNQSARLSDALATLIPRRPEPTAWSIPSVSAPGWTARACPAPPSRSRRGSYRAVPPTRSSR